MSAVTTSRPAWSRLYALAGHLLLDGWSPDAVQAVRALPALAEALPDLDADRLAARHHAAFGLGVPPYAGVLLGAEGHMGGEQAREAADLLRRTGWKSTRTDVEADHLGLLLRAAGFLLAAEVDALEDDREPIVATLRALQVELLDAHLLPAWTPLTLALRGLALTEWDALVDLVGALLVHHRSQLPGEPGGALPSTPGVDLGDAKTGVARICRWLMVCGRSGLWLTRADMGAIAARADVPHGFGDRARMLESLIFAAVDQGRVEPVIEGLHVRVRDWEAGLGELGERGLPTSGWRSRLERTRAVLDTISEAVAES